MANALPRWSSKKKIGSGRLITIPASVFLFLVVIFSVAQYLLFSPKTRYSPDVFSTYLQKVAETADPTTNPYLYRLRQQLTKIAVSDESDWCHRHHSIDRLSIIASNEQPMCQEESQPMTCYEAPFPQGDDLHDNFCTYRNLETIFRDEKPFQLQCSERSPDMVENITQKGKLLISIDTLTKAMFKTGAGEVMQGWFDVSRKPVQESVEIGRSLDTPKPPRWTILLKRELHGSHPWHSLMEIGQLFNTMDVLGLAGRWNIENDRDETQIILLDDEPNVEHMDLARVISSRPVQRWTDLKARYKNARLTFPNAIIPLAGGRHPIWASDWIPYPCTKSEMVDLLVDRLKNLYKIKDRGPTFEKVKVTFVTRPNHRHLQDRERHFRRWQRKFGEHASFEMINFNKLSLKERIDITSKTDVLIGVHGSQLTNLLYLPRRMASVVEILPRGFVYYGFQNLAHVRGLRYFKISAKGQSDSKNWQETQSIIADENELDTNVGAAILSVLRSSLRGS